MNRLFIMKWIKSRLPDWAEIFPVYSVIVFWAYSWFMLVFVFNFPSWLLEITFGEIFSYFSYGVIFVFLDTIIVCAILLGVASVFPSAWLKDDFLVSGSAVASLLYLWIILVQLSYFVIMKLSTSNLLFLSLSILATFSLAVLLVRRVPPFRKAVIWFKSATGVFVFIYGFFTGIGFLVVLIRNLS